MNNFDTERIESLNYKLLKQNLLLENSKYLPNPFDNDKENEFLKGANDPIKFFIEEGDILFTISNPNNLVKEGHNTLNIKLFYPKDFHQENYINFFRNLYELGVNKLQFLTICDSFDKEYNNPYVEGDFKVINILKTNFMDFINSGVYNFGDNNKYTLYLLKKGTFDQIKTLFQVADREYVINFGKGSQKSHICSDIEFRLTLYLFALYNKDFNFLRYSNNFSNLNKNQYTTFKDSTFKNKFIYKDSNHSKIEIKDFRPKIVDINKKRSFHTSALNKETAKITPNESNILESFTYLENIKDIINNSETLELAQYKIETLWLDMMKDKLSTPNSSVWKNISFIIDKASRIIEIHGKTGVLKKRFKDNKEAIVSLRYEIILITISIMISSHSRISSTHLFIQIGKNISYLLYKYYLSNMNEEDEIIEYEEWRIKNKLKTSTDLLKMGNYFGQVFMNEPLEIFTLAVTDEEGDSVQILKVCDNWIDTLKDLLVIQPTSLPMICKPVKWSSTQYGGYINNSKEQREIITGSTYQGHDVQNLEKTYEVVNIMNSIQFTINKELLEYIVNNFDILDIDNLDNTTKLQTQITIKLANIYKDLTFYLNVNSDWRGRLYSSSFFLNYQGSDLSRSLLEFKQGEVLNKQGLKYLQIYGSNCYSNDLSKKSYESRIKWVSENEDKIISLDRELINKASKKLQFVAFCLSYRKYKNDPNSTINLPIFLDATCSGVQHLAAMIQDVNIAKEVNLLESTDSKDVEDIYSTVAQYINKTINQNKTNSKFKDIELTRKILKTSIMTQVYNVKVSGIFNQLKSKLEVVEKLNKKTNKTTKYYMAPTKDGKLVELSYMEVYDIANIISKAIFEIYPPLREIYDYFINMIKLMLKLEIPIVWITPTGLEITQSYYKSDVIKVKLSYFGKNRTAVIREWKPIIDGNKQTLAIIPNIIHSLDASHLMNVVLEGYKNNISPIITIHDCFGTLPNQMDYLSNIIRNEFIKLYTQQDFLNKYHENVYKAIKDNNIEIHHKDGEDYVKLRKNSKLVIPSKPKKGCFDLSRVHNALYLVC
jgi:hypothetical protein